MVSTDSSTTYFDRSDSEGGRLVSRNPRTCKRSGDGYYTELRNFKDTVNKAIRGAFPKEDAFRYRSVHVLLLSWEDDDLDPPCSGEIQRLRSVFEDRYRFAVEEWRIPSDRRSHKMCGDKLNDFVQAHEHRDVLLIIYYAGHGSLDRNRQCIWHCNGTKSSPTVRWYAHLAGDLGDTDSDVLFLLDCCSSGGSRGCSKSGMKELIAAYGYETAPAPGKHSFTTSLIEELWDLSRGPPFSVAHLHDKISARLQHWSPYLDAENLGRRDKEGQDIERRTAPVHFLMNSQVDSSSIVLKPLSSPAPASPSASPGQGSGTSAGPPPKRIKLSPRDNGPHPQVLISVVLGEDYKDGAEIFSDWLCKVPGKVESVHIQAAFHHGSTLLLVSMPIAVWDLLPSHQAYSLVEFVKSDNLLLPPVSTESSSPARQINNPTTSSGIASLSSSAGSWQTSSAATARQKIANDGRAEFVNFLQERNVDLHKSADHMGRNFWGRSLTEPPLTLTGEAGRRWEADLHRNDVDFQGVIKKFLIVHRFTLGSSLAYAWNLQWQCDPVPSKYRHQHDRMPLPKPSSIVALNSRCYFHSTNVGKLTSMICAEAGQEENDPQAFPFLSVEPVNDSCEAAIGKNLHTASQALHNMYVFMKAAGYESVFFEKVRFYSAVISSGGFEVRVHRAVKLDQGRIYPDYPLGFRFDQVLMKDSAYTRKDLATVIKTVLVTYGLEILLPVLQNAVLYRCTEDDEISGAEAKTEV